MSYKLYSGKMSYGEIVQLQKVLKLYSTRKINGRINRGRLLKGKIYKSKNNNKNWKDYIV